MSKRNRERKARIQAGEELSHKELMRMDVIARQVQLYEVENMGKALAELYEQGRLKWL